MSENNNKSVKDERVSNFIRTHGIRNGIVMYLVWFGFLHNLSESVIEQFANKKYDASSAEAKYAAVMLGISEIDDIRTYADIRQKLFSLSMSEFTAMQNSKFESALRKIDTLDTKLNTLTESVSGLSAQPDLPLQTIENLDNFAEKVTTGIGNLESGVYESIDDIKAVLVQCVDALLELSECNLSLLRSAYSMQELLKTMKGNPQSELLEPELKKLEADICSYISETQENLLLKFSGRQGKKAFFSLKSPPSKETPVPDSPSQKPQKEKKFSEKEKKPDRKGIEKYNEIVTRMNDKSKEVTILDYLNLIRTGVFDQQQAQIITKAISERLTMAEITEIAKPEQSAEVMSEILSFLLAMKEGAGKKASRQEEKRMMRTTINKREHLYNGQSAKQSADNNGKKDN